MDSIKEYIARQCLNLPQQKTDFLVRIAIDLPPNKNRRNFIYNIRSEKYKINNTEKRECPFEDETGVLTVADAIHNLYPAGILLNYWPPKSMEIRILNINWERHSFLWSANINELLNVENSWVKEKHKSKVIEVVNNLRSLGDSLTIKQYLVDDTDDFILEFLGQEIGR